MTRFVRILARALAASLVSGAASAQLAHRPFAVGGGEGGGGAEGGITGFLMSEQSRLTHLMAEQVHALHANPSALLGLVALGLCYGVFHAAGPGHGKALIASYMIANEGSLRRGVVMAFLAALLQATVAVVLVGSAALILNATASQMNTAADWLSIASCAGVAAIGLWLSWRKGRALIAAIRLRFERERAVSAASVFANAAWSPPPRALSAAAYRAAAPGAAADLCCAPDPAALIGAFSWRDAAGTVIAAGSRPCSGAILVLVFALAQGVFPAGVAAAFAMALGVAVTTGALAALAVFAKAVALRFAAGENSRAALVASAFEFAAALAVLAVGLLLLIGARGGA
jgi:ABC-type nickel/cobalt efflux system permease component RcnA